MPAAGRDPNGQDFIRLTYCGLVNRTLLHSFIPAGFVRKVRGVALMNMVLHSHGKRFL